MANGCIAGVWRPIAGYGSLCVVMCLILYMVHCCFSERTRSSICSRRTVIEFADERGCEQRLYTLPSHHDHVHRKQASSFAFNLLLNGLQFGVLGRRLRASLSAAQSTWCVYLTIDVDARGLRKTRIRDRMQILPLLGHSSRCLSRGAATSLTPDQLVITNVGRPSRCTTLTTDMVP